MYPSALEAGRGRSSGPESAGGGRDRVSCTSGGGWQGGGCRGGNVPYSIGFISSGITNGALCNSLPPSVTQTVSSANGKIACKIACKLALHDRGAFSSQKNIITAQKANAPTPFHTTRTQPQPPTKILVPPVAVFTPRSTGAGRPSLRLSASSGSPSRMGSP